MLLNEIYGKIKIDIDKVINTCTYLNYVTDELLNIIYEKIVNLYIHTQMSIFQLESKKIFIIKYLAPNLVN